MAKGTIQNKETFLNQIADKLHKKRSTNVTRPEWDHQPQRGVYQYKTAEELCEIFKQSSEEKDTHVVETTKDNLTETIEQVMQNYGGKPMVATDDERFQQFGLTDVMAEHEVHVWDPDQGNENIEEAEKANIGFFFSDVSLAESGTVTQFNGRHNARTVSLLPITYVAIAPKSSIVPRMTQAMEQIHEQVEDNGDIASYINFITGPSNSADIEMNMVAGVHGPVKAVHVLVLDV